MAAMMQLERLDIGLFMLPMFAVEAWLHFREGVVVRWLLRVVAGAVLMMVIFLASWWAMAFLSGVGDGKRFGHWGEFLLSLIWTPIATLVVLLVVGAREDPAPKFGEMVRAWLCSLLLFALWFYVVSVIR